LNIRWFEGLQLISIVIGLINMLAFGTLTTKVRVPALGVMAGALIGELLGVAIGVALTLLVSRCRKNWPRWVILALWALGIALVLWQGKARAILSLDHPLTALVWLMQAVAIVLAFTPQSSRWLRNDQSKALQRVFD